MKPVITVYSIEQTTFDSYAVNGGSDPPIVLSQLLKISIVTTDQGPFLEDVFLILEDELYTFEVEQQAPFFYSLYSLVAQLDDFDFDMLIKAMQCPENQEFLCWQKPGVRK